MHDLQGKWSVIFFLFRGCHHKWWQPWNAEQDSRELSTVMTRLTRHRLHRWLHESHTFQHRSVRLHSLYQLVSPHAALKKKKKIGECFDSLCGRWCIIVCVRACTCVWEKERVEGDIKYIPKLGSTIMISACRSTQDTASPSEPRRGTYLSPYLT